MTRIFITAGIILALVSAVFSERVPLSNIQQRRENKKAISLFQPWISISGGIIDTAGLHANQLIAIHELIHHAPDFFKLVWDSPTRYRGEAVSFTDASVIKALNFRGQLLALNPNLIIIGEVRYYDADTNFLPRNSDWWIQENGRPKPNPDWETYWLLNWENESFQAHVGAQCAAMLETGVFDGCLLDWAKNGREPIFRKVREIIGEDAVLLGNVNHAYDDIDKILPHLSGVYMEAGWWGMINDPADYFLHERETIRMSQESCREPKLICTEVWSRDSMPDLDSTVNPVTGKVQYEIASGQLNIMRAGCAVHYTQTNGYYCFYPQSFKSIFNAHHMHIYHDFFNAYLGRYIPGPPVIWNGAYIKEWENGAVVFNPPQNLDYTITFSEPRRSQATGIIAVTHTIPDCDGDIFLKGDFPQIYAVDNLPGQKDYPDTNYKNQPISIQIPAVSLNPAGSPTRAVTINPMIRNQNILFQKLEAGKNPRYYNTKGRCIQVRENSKK